MPKTVRVLVILLLATLILLAASPGFRSARQFDEHFQKHGREFGNITQDQYLHLAQELRDAPAGGQILEAVKPGGVISRFDRGKATSEPITPTVPSGLSSFPMTGNAIFTAKPSVPNEPYKPLEGVH